MKKLFLYFGILLSSLCFFLIFVLIFLNGTALTCARQNDQTYTCNVQTLLLGKYPTFSHQIDQIVSVETVDDGCFDGCSYRTEFTTANGSNIPLTEVYTDRGPVQKQTSELNLLLKSGQSSFEYARQPLWWVLLLLGGLFIMEVVILTFTMGAGAIRDFSASRRMS